MNVSSRITIVFAFLVGLFVAATAVAVTGLALLGDPSLAVVVGVGGLASVVAGAIAWMILREVARQPAAEDEQADGPATVPQPQGLREAECAAPRISLQSVAAELPQPYLEAVMKGVRANHEALKARGEEAAQDASQSRLPVGRRRARGE